MPTTEEKFKVISTKVSPQAYRSLKKLARKKGLTIYDMLQMCIDTLVRYMSDAHNLTPEMERMMAIFEHLTGWDGAANLADPNADWRVEEATFYLTAKGRKGVRAVHVSKPFMDRPVQTENVQEILERQLNYLIPERYKRLRLIAAYVGAVNMTDLLDRMIDSYDIIEAENQSIRKDFEDADRAENNKPVRYGERTRRVKRQSVESMETRQQTIHFSPEDVPDLPELHHDDDKFNPDTDAIGY